MSVPGRSELRLGSLGQENDARDDYIAVRRMQKPQLYDDEEQEEAQRASGNKEILQYVPQTDGAQRSEIVLARRVLEADRICIEGSRPTVRTPVSKTGEGGSNPSSPARVRRCGRQGTQLQAVAQWLPRK